MTLQALAQSAPVVSSTTTKKKSRGIRLNLPLCCLLLGVISCGTAILISLSQPGGDETISTMATRMMTEMHGVFDVGAGDGYGDAADVDDVVMSMPMMGSGGAIIPIDLSVNHLQRIKLAPGSIPMQSDGAEEDFLPMVTEGTFPMLRFRLKPAWKIASPSGRGIGVTPAALRDITAYQIQARRSQPSGGGGGRRRLSRESGVGGGENEASSFLWDTRKVSASSMPRSIPWEGEAAAAAAAAAAAGDDGDAGAASSLKAGMIVEWRVRVWDGRGMGPSSSSWTKFGVGPSRWEGKWIVHPNDASQFVPDIPYIRMASPTDCLRWKARRPLPVARALVDVTPPNAKSNPVTSALLVVSGLGSFHVTWNGKPLSSSSPMDPAHMDYSARVSYRGYDVTSHFNPEYARKSTKASSSSWSSRHVVGITLGASWWDPRPMRGSIIKDRLMHHGPLTTVAQLHLTYADGTTVVKIPTGSSNENHWQITKGFFRDSELFTGDTIDLGTFHTMKGWDTPKGWTPVGTATENTPGGSSSSTSTSNHHFVEWIEPILYASDATRDQCRNFLEQVSGAIPKTYRHDRDYAHMLKLNMAPIGELIPSEAPPVMPIHRRAPESIVNLGGGRWLFDFGTAMSGVVRFEEGLPNPIVPPNGVYPRGHAIETPQESGSGRIIKEDFITVVYGESLEMETGDINLVLTAGSGFHDGGPRKMSRGPNPDTAGKAGPCYPLDHGGVLTQRDVFVISRGTSGDQNKAASFADARQSLFTYHGFRFAEVCCTAEPPRDVHALGYRTAFQEWGTFHSNHVTLNAVHELTKNALDSNMLGTQTDCPHREKLQYGGDLVADSPAAMHFFDLGAFYSKVIHDWIDMQWSNGAYTETSIWQDLNEHAAIGYGAGETVWASLPPVLTVRHVQHYGDHDLIRDTFGSHVHWLHFLSNNWEEGMEKLFYFRVMKNLTNFGGGFGGLGDWLSVRYRDTWLTHHAFFMASARAVAYLAQHLENDDENVTMTDDGGNMEGDPQQEDEELGVDVLKVAKSLGEAALVTADEIRDKINSLYMKYDSFEVHRNWDFTPGPDLGLFARIVPGEKRCRVLEQWVRNAGRCDLLTWPGDEEQLFYRHVHPKYLEEQIRRKKVYRGGKDDNGNDRFGILWTRRHNIPDGILGVRYSLKALSDSGFHDIALSRVTGTEFPSFEYMLSHNATTMWETYWRSEDVYSRNHPMLGAVAEWMASAVAGVSLAPKTVGGEDFLFWPRIPTSARVVWYASATQGSKRGDATIAWEFVGLPETDNINNPDDGWDTAKVQAHIRIMVPPASTGLFKLVPPPSVGENDIMIKFARKLPNLEVAKASVDKGCRANRKARKGFPYNWEYDRKKKLWNKFYSGKAIGTPCRAFLLHPHVTELTQWSPAESVARNPPKDSGPILEIDLAAGLYDIVVKNWQLEKELEDVPGYAEYKGSLGPYCSDPETFTWDVRDATHII